MNVLILINSAPKYKYFYYNLGEALKEKGVNVFYAVDSVRSCYLEPLPSLDKGSNTFYFDEFFKKNYDADPVEYAFEVTWGEYFFSEFDRFLTHNFNLKKPKEYWLKVRYCLDLFFDQLIKKNQVDAVVYENVSNSFAYAAYKASQRNGIKYLGLMASRLPGRYEIHTSVLDNELQRLRDLAREEPSEEECQWYEDYRSKIIDIAPDYMKYNNLEKVNLARLVSFEKIRQFMRLVFSLRNPDIYYDYQFGHPLEAIQKAFWVNVKRKFSSVMSRNFFEEDAQVRELMKCEKYYVYPIHYHPESSTSVLSPLYTNEFNNILNIANSLPFGVMLYVKDHASAYGFPSPDFYRKVAAVPNVRLIRPGFNIKKLIVDSQGLITVNSTAGFEALILNRPVFLLGNVFYQEFPGVFKLKSFSDIPESLSLSKTKVDWGEVSRSVISYRRYTLPGDVRIDDYGRKDMSYFISVAENVVRMYQGDD